MTETDRERELREALQHCEAALGCQLQWLRDSLQPLWRTGSMDERRNCEERLSALDGAWRASVRALTARR